MATFWERATHLDYHDVCSLCYVHQVVALVVSILGFKGRKVELL